MKAGTFVHLHQHSHYSLLGATCRIDELVARAAELQMPALALTDHGNLFGAVEFYRAAVAAGIKPILGMEAYVAPGSRRDRHPVKGYKEPATHLTLLASSNAGYENLVALSTLAYREGFYHKPRVDAELLARHSAGLIALSGCRHSAFGRAAAADDLPGALAALDALRQTFGPDHCFIEIQNHGLEAEAAVRDAAVRASRELGMPLVATNDAHYLHKDDARAHDVLLAISTGQLVSDPDRPRYETPEFYLKSPAEMRELFRDHPEAADATLAIAERCRVELDFDTLHLPRFSDEDPVRRLRDLCAQGLAERYRPPTPQALQRLDYELGVIEKMDFSSYFLVVWDICRFAREIGVRTGGGRGSAAGSIVSYVLRITDIDPLAHDLIFERFLNPGRAEMPDIDLDVADTGRQQVLSYLRERYGGDNVSQVITFSKMGAKQVIRDTARALGFDRLLADRLAKRIPVRPGITLAQALAEDRELAAEVDAAPPNRELFEIAGKLEGICRHVSKHAAAVVIADKPLTRYLPLYSQDGEETTQYDMHAVGQLGLLKIDVLGLQALSIIDETLRLVKQTHGREISIDTIPLDDAATFKLLCAGRVRGLFQLDSSTSIREMIVKMQPDSLADIVATVALHRPGPMNTGMDARYINSKHGLEQPAYAHPGLRPVLEETHGAILYQEQIMRIAHDLAGFSMSDADGLRKAMGKKKAEVMEEARAEFTRRAVEKGVPAAVAGRISDQLQEFAKYCFNKSHATAYGLLCYQTAYLKTHHPVEYMAALMSGTVDKTDKIVEYLDECRALKIAVQPPDVNFSEHGFTVGDGAIRSGLRLVKMLGDRGIDRILAARRAGGPFRSLPDFLERMDAGALDKRNLESLVTCGAFASLGHHRSQLMELLPNAVQWAAMRREDRRTGQLSIFSGGGGPAAEGPRPPDVPEWPVEELLRYEKETMGLYVTTNPLLKYEALLADLSTARLESLAERKEWDTVTLGGIITAAKTRIIKTGANKGQRMMSFTFMDLTGSAEAVAFSEAYEKYRRHLAEDRVVFLQATVTLRNDAPQLRVDEVIPVERAAAELAGLVRLRVHAAALEPSRLHQLKEILREHPGSVSVLMEVTDPDGTSTRLDLGPECRVTPDDLLAMEVADLFGAGTLHLSPKPREKRGGTSRLFRRPPAARHA